jgi:hypothetical protein
VLISDLSLFNEMKGRSTGENGTISERREKGNLFFLNISH